MEVVESKHKKEKDQQIQKIRKSFWISQTHTSKNEATINYIKLYNINVCVCVCVYEFVLMIL